MSHAKCMASRVQCHFFGQPPYPCEPLLTPSFHFCFNLVLNPKPFDYSAFLWGQGLAGLRGCQNFVLVNAFERREGRISSERVFNLKGPRTQIIGSRGIYRDIGGLYKGPRTQIIGF